MRRVLMATAMGAALCLTSLQPAKAYRGGVFFGGPFAFGAFSGLATGVVVGSALARPYYPYPYPYPYYGYPYGYGAPVVYPAPVVVSPYAAPYPYASPAPSGYVPSGYAPPPSQPTAPRAPSAPTCRPDQFFNTNTGSCDRR